MAILTTSGQGLSRALSLPVVHASLEKSAFDLSLVPFPWKLGEQMAGADVYKDRMHPEPS